MLCISALHFTLYTQNFNVITLYYNINKNIMNLTVNKRPREDESHPLPTPHDGDNDDNNVSRHSLNLPKETTTSLVSLQSSQIIIFPNLETFQTISNTRIEKDTQHFLNYLNSNILEIEAAYQESEKQPLQEEEEDDDNLVHFFDPVPSKYLSMSDTPNTARDSEFSYDYETYMVELPLAKEWDKVCLEKSRLEEEDVAKLASPEEEEASNQEEGQDVANNRPKDSSIANPTFGLELLDMLESVIIRLCHSPIRIVEEAFKESGAFGFGPIYEVCKRAGGLPILYMTETSNCMNRLLSCTWIGCTPSFTAQIVDGCGKMSMTVTNSGVDYCSCCRTYCCCRWGSTSSKEFRVTLANGELLGSICPRRGKRFLLKDSELHKLIYARGPECSILSSILAMMCCCFTCFIEDNVFYFTEKCGKLVAQVKKIKMKVPVNLLMTQNDRGDNNNNNGKKNKKKNISKSDDNHNYAPLQDSQEDLCKNNAENLDYIKSYQILVDFAPKLGLKKKSLILSASFLIDFLYWQSSSDLY